MKKIISIILAVTSFLALTACGSGSGTSGDKMYIPVIAKGFQHQYWQVVKKGADAAAKELGVDIYFDGPASETEIDSQVNMIKNEMPTRDYKIVDILADMEIFIKENAKDVKYRPKLNDIIELYNKINSTFSVNSEDMKKAIAEKYQSRLPVVIDKKMNKLKRERQKILQFLNRSGYNETLIEVKSEPKMKILIKKLNILSQNIEKELDR